MKNLHLRKLSGIDCIRDLSCNQQLDLLVLEISNNCVPFLLGIDNLVNKCSLHPYLIFQGLYFMPPQLETLQVLIYDTWTHLIDLTDSTLLISRGFCSIVAGVLMR